MSVKLFCLKFHHPVSDDSNTAKIQILHKFSCVSKSGSDEPPTVEEALTGSDAAHWKHASEDDHQSFEENQAWTLGDIPEEATCVKCMWVFKKKTWQCGKYQVSCVNN